MKTIQDVREETFDDLCDKLLKYGKCMVIRPTGFGKTYMTTRLMSLYERVLFLYPTNIIADVVKGIYGEKDNVVYMSYAGFIKKSSILMEDYDLVVCDECHRLGAEKTNVALKDYLATRRNCKLVGLTATPNRTDGYSVLSDLFNGIKTFSYTLHDAIQDGFIAKPYYCFMSYGYKDDVEYALRKGLKCIDCEVNEKIKAELFGKYSESNFKVWGRDVIIREMCNKYIKKHSYMKFMWFFPTKDNLLQSFEEVVNDFKNAYPGYDVRSTIIISDYEYVKNTKLLEELEEQDNLIDIIFSVDMLNMGYHVNNVTGVGLCRATDSNIIFMQQIGRCINTIDVDSEPKIIFDFVDNISRSAVYEADTGRENSKYDKVENLEDNFLIGEDIQAIGNVASYKEFLRKIELEPKKQMCRNAYWKWKQFGGGIDRPDVPIEVFAMLYGVSVEDILEEFKLKDIYGYVSEESRVSEEILNETGLY